MRAFWIILGIIGAALIALLLASDQGSVLGIRNDTFASAVYMGIWATLIGAAIIPRSGGLGTAARNAAVWLTLILMLMAGYVYRFELQDFASRLTAGLIPGSPVSSQTSEGRNQVMLIRANSGHFEADAFVEGAQIRFVVDTGASSVVLSHADAIKVGIDTSQLSYSTPVSTANGVTQAARIRLSSLDIGEVKRDNVSAMVAREGNLDVSLLGMSFLGSLWSFEMRGDRLILTD